MATQKKCLFHRALNVSSYGFGIGLCDIEGEDTVCDGDIRHCEKRETFVNAFSQNFQVKEAEEDGAC